MVIYQKKRQERQNLWHEKMKMVQLLGRDWLGIEIYPPYKFTVDTANQYHIICIPPDYVDGFLWLEAQRDQRH